MNMPHKLLMICLRKWNKVKDRRKDLFKWQWQDEGMEINLVKLQEMLLKSEFSKGKVFRC